MPRFPQFETVTVQLASSDGWMLTQGAPSRPTYVFLPAAGSELRPDEEVDFGEVTLHYWRRSRASSFSRATPF
jgi:hypothetical protein